MKANTKIIITQNNKESYRGYLSSWYEHQDTNEVTLTTECIDTNYLHTYKVSKNQVITLECNTFIITL